MNVIGLDIGTTSICATVVDAKTGKVFEAVNVANDSFLPSQPWEKIQDPAKILSKAKTLISQLTQKYALIGAIGVTGQMHGIVYLGQNGSAVSPLYIWQDGRGDLPYQNDQTYAQTLSAFTGCHLATGFGAVTHFYNLKNGLIPKEAVTFCTIHDYVTMKLSNRNRPLTHASDAASFGLFDLQKSVFDRKALEKAGIDPSFFPAVTGQFDIIGKTESGIPITVAIGDNQASFLGSVKDPQQSILVNIGTGSQISLFSDGFVRERSMETRPLFENNFLLVGASLCGGRAYAILEHFFRSVVEMAGVSSDRLYPAMDKLSEGFETLENKLRISTQFSGTRENPALRGSVQNLGIENFTPQHFVVGVLEGIADELYQMYAQLKIQTDQHTVLIGSGNGIRSSAVMRKMFSQKFGLPIRVPLYKEEAAYGAALTAMTAAGFYTDIHQAQQIIRYEEVL
ncbi:MAG TPA: FGGY family carbohydrate kinase [Oscillospiraceae bacterium]|nr:FGGY family carbohydrate kinase [Oscillospiraceae bacterium]HPF56814.1 FGGY family carbohydrate kinase [Clostridiales bacterium]HPK34578.1 FGGY family carbohydrate kinase [Oscillospiraceae bacterium]HPR75958.1 FGGY family carbohydrate kinase [Oscillospiraceae bacterium]